MSLDMNYFRSIQGAMGLSTNKDAKTEEIKSNIIAEFENSINCETNSMRNGVLQKLQVIPTKSSNICIIKSKPNETFNLGDEISCYNQKWIVTEKSPNEQIQSSGKIKQCNHLFRFQNFDTTIHEYWGVLENPSTTLDNGAIITSPSNKMKAYLPYNEFTKDIFIGKRFMTELIKDKDGNEVGAIYNVSGFDGETNHYGNNRLLVLSLESGTFNPSTDNKEKMICDYKDSIVVPPIIPTLLKCEVKGSDVLKNTGIARTYNSVFYKSDGITIDNTIMPTWTVDLSPEQNNKITWKINGQSLEVKCADCSDILGTTFKITLADNSGVYNSAEKLVKIVSVAS